MVLVFPVPGLSVFFLVKIPAENTNLLNWPIDGGSWLGGVKGGNIVAEGKPEEVCKVKDSYTGQFLKPLLA